MPPAWSRLAEADVFEPRGGHRTAVLGTTLFVVGGFTPGPSAEIVVSAFDLERDRWLQEVDCEGALVAQRAGHSLVALGSNRLVLFGGEDASTGELLGELVVGEATPAAVTWTAVTLAAGAAADAAESDSEGDEPPEPPPEPEARAWHAATAVGWGADANRVAVVGGMGARGPLDDVWLLTLTLTDAAAGRWARVACSGDGPGASAFQSACFAGGPSDALLVFGGAQKENGAALPFLLHLDGEGSSVLDAEAAPEGKKGKKDKDAPPQEPAAAQGPAARWELVVPASMLPSEATSDEEGDDAAAAAAAESPKSPPEHSPDVPHAATLAACVVVELPLDAAQQAQVEARRAAEAEQEQRRAEAEARRAERQDDDSAEEATPAPAAAHNRRGSSAHKEKEPEPAEDEDEAEQELPPDIDRGLDDSGMTGFAAALVLGGRDARGTVAPDAFAFRLATREWERLEPTMGEQPPPQAGHALAYCGALRRAVVVGCEQSFALQLDAAEPPPPAEPAEHLGYGRQALADGSVAVGRFKKNALNGDGRLEYAGGDVYDGQFRGGRREGHGVLTLAGGAGRYEGDWERDERHGQGSMEYGEEAKSGEARYDGAWVDGQRCGQGVLTFRNGDVLTGQFANDRANGPGVLEYASGARYEGLFKDGLRDDERAYYRYDDGTVYVGPFALGVQDGVGESSHLDGENYVGIYRAGRRNGTGKSVLGNGDAYSGKYMDGVRHGLGTMTYAAGHVYEGLWARGERSGRGKMTWANGDTYEGQWARGQMNGRGRHVVQSGDVVLEGEFKDGLLHGRGQLEHHVGLRRVFHLRYDGQWRRGRKHGRGQAWFRNGDHYEGDWADNERCGRGRCEYPSGHVYEGEWARDVRHGRGELTGGREGLVRFAGPFVDGEPQGDGVGSYASGDEYEGCFDGGDRCGHGVCRYASGDVYTGAWLGDMRHGYGVLEAASGEVYRGEWKRDRRHVRRENWQGLEASLELSVLDGVGEQ